MSKTAKRRCEIDGVEYPSIVEAARALGMSDKSVNSKLRNENFPTWKLLGEPTRKVMGIRGTTFVVHGVSYPKRITAAVALKVSEGYISKLVDDPKREDCYRILPDGKKFKNTERFEKNRKTMIRAIEDGRKRKRAQRAADLESGKFIPHRKPLGRPPKEKPESNKESSTWQPSSTIRCRI